MRAIRWLLALVFGTITLGGAALWVTVRPWWHRWGVDPAVSDRELPGDELVRDAVSSDTRTLTIDAAPADVWPWLVQMGYGRAGWYSYDAIDMRGQSATEILPAFQSLAAGDVVPTHPGGGFEARIVEPGRAIVLYIDSDMARQQTAAAKAAAAAGGEATPANLAAAGAFMGSAQPTEFSASWAFVLDPIDDGRCRLIERVRVRFDGGDRAWTPITTPLVGFGLFVMVRRQLLGIKARVERAARGGLSGAPAGA